MAIGNYYPVSGTVVDQDLFLGTKAGNNNTVNYTAQTVANYLNTNSKVAIGGQISFRFDISPNIPKTISFSGGGGSGTPFSSITQLIVSGIDLSSTDITIFLNYLNGSEILLAQQNQPNLFGNYKITSYTQIGTSNFYTLGLQFIGGNGTITENTYYNLSSFVLSSGIDVPTLNQVLTAGNTSIIDAKVGNLYSYDNVNADYGIVQFYDSGVALKGASTNNLLFYNDDTGTVKFSNGTYAPTLNFAGVGNNVYTFQNANGTLAFLSDIPSLSGYVPYTGATGPVNLGAYNLTVNGLTVGKGNNNVLTNTAFGISALSLVTVALGNTAIGYQAAQNNTIGNSLTAIGSNALASNTIGNFNTAVGLNSLTANTIGNYNTAIGLVALTTNVSGNYNTSLGHGSLRYNTTGNNSLGLGVFAGASSQAGLNLTVATESIFIGSNTKSLVATSTNEIVIGANAEGLGNNTIVLGNNSVVTTALRGDVGIGTTSPSQKLHISGNLRVTGALYDSTNSPGTLGQVLASTVTGTDWVSLSEITGVDGTGTANYVSKWLDANTITNSLIYDNGTNVGIGTASPTQKLQVNGNGLFGIAKIGNWAINSDFARFGHTSYDGATNFGFLQYSNGETYIEGATNNFYATTSNIFSTASIERMRITSSGSVGIGTTTPGTINSVAFAGVGLQVTSGSQGRVILEGSSQAELLLNDSGATANQRIKAITSDGGKLFLGAYDDNGTSRKQVTIDDSGNVGVGTTFPLARLQVRAPGALSTNIAFRVKDSADSADFMVVNGLGNVGIGITTPSDKLEVSGSGNVAIRVRTSTNTGSDYAALRYVQDATEVAVTYTNLGNYITSLGGTERMRILANGNVGIGTTAPGSKLQISGANSEYLPSTSLFSLRKNEEGYGLFVGVSGSGNAWLQAGTSNDAFNYNLILQSRGGNVGIGTTAPSYKLEVQGTGTSTPLRVVSSGNTSILLSRAGTTDNGDATLTVTNSGALNIAAQNVIRMVPYSSEIARFTNTGLGIGTTSPVGRLDVRAPGALSIDTAFRVRNSADSNNLMIINGAGGIGVGTTSPLPSAVLDINSTTQGFLPPRMTNAQRTAISLPAIGLMVYCTDATEGLYIYKSTGWTFII